VRKTRQARGTALQELSQGGGRLAARSPARQPAVPALEKDTVPRTRQGHAKDTPGAGSLARHGTAPHASARLRPEHRSPPCTRQPGWQRSVLRSRAPQRAPSAVPPPRPHAGDTGIRMPGGGSGAWGAGTREGEAASTRRNQCAVLISAN